MRRSQGKNSKILVPLTIASIVIWGVIIYNIITYFTASSEQDVHTDDEVSLVQENKQDDKQTNDADSIEYKRLSRDPFLFKKIERPRVVREHIPQKKDQIHYRINGILINSSSKLVVFEDLTNNKTLFLREDESYNDITIKQISDNKIVLIDRMETKEITVN